MTPDVCAYNVLTNGAGVGNSTDYSTSSTPNSTLRVAAVGIGGAGGRIVERLWQDNERRETTYPGAACAVDTDAEALDELDALPADRRYAFGLSETRDRNERGPNERHRRHRRRTARSSPGVDER